MLQMAEYHNHAVSAKPPTKKPSIKVRRQKLLSFLQGIVVYCLTNINILCSFYRGFCLREKYEPGVFIFFFYRGSSLCGLLLLVDQVDAILLLTSFYNIDCIDFAWQKNMNLYLLSGRRNDVLCADGSKTGTTTKLSSAIGIAIVRNFFIILVVERNGYKRHILFLPYEVRKIFSSWTVW